MDVKTRDTLIAAVIASVIVAAMASLFHRHATPDEATGDRDDAPGPCWCHGAVVTGDSEVPKNTGKYPAEAAITVAIPEDQPKRSETRPAQNVSPGHCVKRTQSDGTTPGGDERRDLRAGMFARGYGVLTEAWWLGNWAVVLERLGAEVRGQQHGRDRDGGG